MLANWPKLASVCSLPSRAIQIQKTTFNMVMFILKTTGSMPVLVVVSSKVLLVYFSIP